MLKSTTEETEKSPAYRSDVPEGTTRTQEPLTPFPGMGGAGRSQDRIVSPDELAAALQAISDERHEVLHGTLPLEETLRQMQLNVPADQVWQKVQANRAKAPLQNKTKGKKQNPALLAAVGVIALIAIFFAIRSTAEGNRVLDGAPAATQTSPQTTARGPQFQSSGTTGVNPLRQAGIYDDSFYWMPQKVRSLASIKDGETYVKDLMFAQTIEKALKNVSKSDYDKVFFEPQDPTGGFRIVRFGDRWFVRGFISEKVVQKPSPGNMFMEAKLPPTVTLAPVVLYNQPVESAKFRNPKTRRMENGGPAKIPIQIPMDALYGGSGNKSNNGIFYCEMAVDLNKVGEDAYKPWSNR